MTTTITTEINCIGKGLDLAVAISDMDSCPHEKFATKAIEFFARDVFRIMNNPGNRDCVDQLAASVAILLGYSMHAGVRKEDIMTLLLKNLSKNEEGKLTDLYQQMWEAYHQPAHPNGTTPSDLFQEMIQQAAKHKDNEKGG